jgi:phthalate 4,5-dioxygenase oxygenase subunit
VLTTDENSPLTRVAGHAPMARLMKQQWTPACLIEEVAEADGAPFLVEALGEGYVAFLGRKVAAGGRRSEPRSRESRRRASPRAKASTQRA